MKLFFILSLGLIASVSAVSSHLPEAKSRKSLDQISLEMETRYEMRDAFREKGNSLVALKVFR